MFAALAKEIGETGPIIFLWVALGVPWKWSKFHRGKEVDWIGYWLSVADFRLEIWEKRADGYGNGFQRPLTRGLPRRGTFSCVGQALLCSGCFGTICAFYGAALRLGRFLSCCGTLQTMSTRIERPVW